MVSTLMEEFKGSTHAIDQLSTGSTMKHTVSAPFLGRTGSSERTPLLSGQREMNNVVADAEPGLTDNDVSQVQLDHKVFEP